MAGATSKATLPKSKTGVSTPTSAPTAKASDEITARNRTGSEPQAEDADFIHPDHVIPPRDYSRFNELIIVCCHAIYLPNAEDADFPLKSPHDEKNWLLAPFQTSDPETGKPGEHSTFLAHAQAGISALTVSHEAHLEKNLLIFSGGATKQSRTPISEARSYYHAVLAEELAEGHLGGGRTHELYRKGRILLEEHATDSFQNLLLSIVLFRKTTGSYPSAIRIITHAFKSKRFLELHAPSIRWPASRIQIQGIDPVLSGVELTKTLEGEEKFGYMPWENDPLGSLLKDKRRQRGWDDTVTEELVEGLEPGVKELFTGNKPTKLPWEEAPLVS